MNLHGIWPRPCTNRGLFQAVALGGDLGIAYEVHRGRQAWVFCEEEDDFMVVRFASVTLTPPDAVAGEVVHG